MSIRRKNIWLFLLADSLIITISLFGAYLLRFDFIIPKEFFSNAYYFLVVLLFSKLSVNVVFNIYSGLWKYTSVTDLLNIIKASSAGTILSAALTLVVLGFFAIPRSIFLLDYILSTIGFISIRVAVRIYSNYFVKKQNQSKKINDNNKTKLLLLGAGWSAEKIIRDILESPSIPYRIIGLLDDDESKTNTTIHGIPIFGKIETIHTFNIPFDEIIICMPGASSSIMRQIVDHCKGIKKPYRTIPTMSELIDKKVSLNAVRDVSIMDLLGRQEVNLNRSEISKYIFGKKVLVTGAGGSIGSELVKQCLGFDPDLLILFDQSENNLFHVENMCFKFDGNVGVQPILGDIRDKTMINTVFNSFKPDVVLHAAAYKHVPMQELNPWEAVNTNVQGTINLVDACEIYGVERFVLVSTDKAVNPTNVMGATKRVAEQVIQARSIDTKVKYMAVRFGNVIGSSGSVIPTFQDQIKNGGPVTITDPNIKRYFMSIPEAAQLILQAGSIGHGGEIFVLDMGEPVLIKDIASELIKLSGFTPNVDILIEYIGLRPGEKMFEELITTGENITDSPHEKIMILKNEVNHGWNQTLAQSENIVELAKLYDSKAIKESLVDLVPEYIPDSNHKEAPELKNKIKKYL
ncbi:MAG: polysaccharide biosynthesis protein [Candidatus Neomarinimicrobiota bacterium]